MKHLLTLGAVALFLGGCANAPQSSQAPAMRELANGIMEHPASGMQFPVSLAGFTRVGVRQYDQNGTNISAGYNTTPTVAPISLTIYVYPSPPITSVGSPAAVAAQAKANLARGMFDQAKAEVMQVFPTAKIVNESEVPPPRSVQHDSGYFAQFTYATNFAGGVRPVESLLYVYCYVGDQWTIKYRVTYPTKSIEARAMVNQFIQDLPWTIRSPHTPPP